jgi:UDP-N-acetylmuramoylalanine--D-glutamate ligase
VNDSQATIPEAAMRAMQAFPAPVTLIAGGRAKLENADAFDELGRAIAGNAHMLVTIGEARNASKTLRAAPVR